MMKYEHILLTGKPGRRQLKGKDEFPGSSRHLRVNPRVKARSNNGKTSTTAVLFLWLFILLMPAFSTALSGDIRHEILLTISGRVTIPAGDGVKGLPGVNMIFSSPAGETTAAKTDLDGYYTHGKNYRWTGTVTPQKGGFTFTPSSQQYDEITRDYTGQNYAASLPVETLEISGRVLTGEGAGLAGVLLEFLDPPERIRVVTDAQGNYRHTVVSGWTGTVIPLKDGYDFIPGSMAYENVTLPQAGRDYRASAVPLVISGRVTAVRGTGMAGVTVTFSPGGWSTITDFNGNYSLGVPHDWTGNAGPGKTGYEFEPSVRTYENTAFNRAGQDYTGTALSPVISGRVRDGEKNGIAGAALIFSRNGGTAMTDADGFYHHAVERDWSGTVSLWKSDYGFSPPGLSYKQVRNDHSGQDYKGTAQSPVIRGTVTNAGGMALAGIRLNFSANGETGAGESYAYTGTMGHYNHAVKRGWSGGVSPAHPRYRFSPPGRPYENLETGTSSQDYTAVLVTPVISGIVTASTAQGVRPLGGAALIFSSGGGTAVTDSGGYFERQVGIDWTGTLILEKAGYVFLPASQNYAHVRTDLSGQNFMALPGSIALTLRATAKTAGTLLIKKNYAYISLTVEIVEIEDPVPIYSYIISRKKPGGQYMVIHEILSADLQSGETYNHIDGNIPSGSTYIYKARAVHINGLSIKESDEQEVKW